MKSKAAAISAEKKRLEKIFEEIPENKKKLVAKLIDNAAFMAATLEELQETVNAEGPTFVSKNGNGFNVVQEHPAQRSYIAMIGKYSGVIKQLEGMLPTDASATPGAALMNFLRDSE